MLTAHAQQKEFDYSGDWCIASNSAEKQYYGKPCAINIHKTDSGYFIKHTNDDFSDFSPPEGVYKIIQGTLFKDGLIIVGKDDKLVYGRNGSTIVMRTFAYMDELDSVFRRGVYFLDHADTTGVTTKNDVAKCNAAMNIVLGEDPECIGCYFNKALGFIKTMEWDSAAFNYMVARKIRPDFKGLDSLKGAVMNCIMKVGWEKYGKAGNYKMAIKVYKKAVKVDSNNVDAWYNLGGANYSDSQFTEALAAFRKALEIDPDYENAQQCRDAAIDALSDNKKTKH